ncbi:MAG: aminotransferase class I/II-fold pyridoxal phosphate-dependent enzyme [Clostridia bacterium]|nr:aminotransferase class I/II-fold pyridoxal phosphate-dependent enzyme [Clostridia bacterium]
MTIFEELKKNSAARLPMHMPGHKRHLCADYLRILGADVDISETDGFDDLNAPEGVILEAERNAARLYGTEEAFFLVGGSTSGILAGAYHFLSPGDRVVVARNCHKSVYNAVEICGAVPDYILPDADENGIYLDIKPEAVRRKLESGGAKLVVVTSPTYEGVISDLKAIKKTCEEFGVPLLVDAAHGAHLDLSGHFTGGAVNAGADITVCSLHKTLPSLTQTAIAFTKGISRDCFQRAVSVFQTSSPSYLLLASADGCINLIKDRPCLFDCWSGALSRFYEKTAAFGRLRVFSGGGAFGFDRSKIVILTGGTGLSGFDAARMLREDGIEPEMAAEGYLIAMTGIFDGDYELDRLFASLKRIDGKAGVADAGARQAVPLPAFVTTPKKALSLPCEDVPAEEAEGRTSAEYIYAYPPGIPLIVPGEEFSNAVVSAAKNVFSKGGRIVSSCKTLKTVKVIKK